jgi:hypothetical protein
MPLVPLGASKKQSKAVAKKSDQDSNDDKNNDGAKEDDAALDSLLAERLSNLKY